MSDPEKLCQIIQKGNFKRILKYLQTRKIKIQDFTDKKGNTILHLATLNGNLNLIRNLKDQVNSRKIAFEFKDSSISVLQFWANQQNNEGFLAIHYAAYRGFFVRNIKKILLQLEEMGSRLDSVNKDGLGLIHTASQGDQALVISYLHAKGLDVSLQDKKGGTPLHWASYMGCEISSSLLLSWDVPVNLKDQDGQTPLHLASLAGNSRIIKALLIKGGDISIKDKKGKTASDLAHENQKHSILHMLRPVGFCDEFKLKAPLRPSKKSFSGLFWFSLLFSVKISLTSLWCAEYYQEKALASYWSLESLWIISCIVAVRKDPGYIKRQEKDSLFSLYESQESHLVCPDCVVLRIPRSRHCQFCNKCVEKFDHHCPWINNCIGAKNLGWFLWFVLVTLTSLIASLAVVASLFRFPERKVEILDVPDVVREVLIGINLALLVGFTLIVAILAVFQVQNFCRGVTTSERLTDKGENLDKRYSWSNFKAMCCNSLKDLEKLDKDIEGKANHEDLIVELQTRP